MFFFLGTSWRNIFLTKNHDVALDAPNQPVGFQALLKAEGVLQKIQASCWNSHEALVEFPSHASHKIHLISSNHLLVQCPEASSVFRNAAMQQFRPKSFTPHRSPLRLNSPPGTWVQPAQLTGDQQSSSCCRNLLLARNATPALHNDGRK